MKKLLLLTAVAVMGLTNVNAQDENTTGGFAKGDVYATGSVGYTNSKVGEVKASSFTFSPAAGYFINENIALEATLIVGFGESTIDVDGDSFSVDINTFGGGLGATYFFTPANQFSFTTGVGVTYVNTKTEFAIEDSAELSTDTFAFVIAPGVNYFVSDCIALRASIGALGYSSTKLDVEGAEAINTFNIGVNLSDVNFGITYKF